MKVVQSLVLFGDRYYRIFISFVTSLTCVCPLTDGSAKSRT